MADGDQFEHLWFLDTLVTIRVSSEAGSDAVSLLEHRAPVGHSPPLHIHRHEDEVFHVLSGQLRFVIGGESRTVGPDSTFVVPKGVPHQFRVESEDGGHWFTVTTGRDFERFVRAMGRSASALSLPPAGPPPSPEAVGHLTDVARRHGIEVVGPPLH